MKLQRYLAFNLIRIDKLRKHDKIGVFRFEVWHDTFPSFDTKEKANNDREPHPTLKTKLERNTHTHR